MRIPLSAPEITEADVAAVAGVLSTTRLSMGPKLQEFEHAVAEYVGAPHAVAVNSGTSGLHLCLRSLGVSEGDEVIVPSFAFSAVANVLLYEKAVPVFVDIDPETLNLDPEKVEAAITPRTRAILVVHTFGCPAELTDILEIARRHRLSVIEDACEALGAEYEGKKVGPLGDVGVFAFYPNKQITTGEGGILVTRNSALAASARLLRNQGRDRSEDWCQQRALGYSYRLSEINCALGIAQLKRIEHILSKREAIAQSYQQGLTANSDLTRPLLRAPRRRISWFAYVVRLSERFSRRQRDWIRNEMAARGIECGRYFAPIHWQPFYRATWSARVNLPVTESSAARSLALPFFNTITQEQIAEVCRTLNELTPSAP